jgi:restriction system protein
MKEESNGREPVSKTKLFDPCGGYRRLNSFTFSTLIYLETIRFCERFLTLKNDPKGRLYDQMVQAARSGRANIMEGSERSATSKEDEIKLTDVARASLSELMGDYEIWILRHDQSPWAKESPEGHAAASFWLDPPGEWKDLMHDSGDYIRGQHKRLLQLTETDDSVAVANVLLVLCKRTILLLQAQIKSQGEQFAQQGGFRERMSAVRLEARDAQQQQEGAPACPECGKSMRQMIAKRGRNAGNAFWSCTGYPACSGTRPYASK